MKQHKFLLALIAGASLTLASCDNDFEQVPVDAYEPHATMQANTTLEELKTTFDQDVNFYSTLVGTKENGEHYIVKGRVVSSDEAGNIFKKIAIEDATGGAVFSINAYDLYQTYKYGQMLVVDVTGMYYGNYGAGVQIGGKPDGDAATTAPSRMAENLWTAAVETDGFCEPGLVKIYNFTIQELLDLHADRATMLQYQGCLVRVKDVSFENPGKELATSGVTNNTSYIVDANGKKLALNTSGYSTFWNLKQPKGKGNVVAVLTNYTSGWQLLLNNAEGLEGFTPWTDEPEPEPEAVTSFNVDFENNAIPDTWRKYQLEGNKDWYVTSFQNNYYAAMTGYKGTAPFDSWLVTEPLDVDKMAQKTISFQSQVNGYGSTTTTFEVYALTTQDPTTATKTLLPAQLATAPASGYSGFTPSGDIDLSGFSGKICIGFRYAATTDANYATWCIDDVVAK